MEKLKEILKKEENIFFIIKLILEIISFSLVCLLCSLSSKNPFDKITIEDRKIYFYDKININITNEKRNPNNNNNSYDSPIEPTQLVTEENCSSVNGSDCPRVDSASPSFCDDMYNSFERNKNQNLSYIFDLNYDSIRKFSLLTMITFSCYLILFVTNFILKVIYLKNKRHNAIRKRIVEILILLLMSLAWLAKTILYLFLLYYIDKGDIGKYDDFFTCEKVKKTYFKQFSDIEKLRKCFLFFVGLNLISDVLDKLEQLFDPYKKKVEENIESDNNMTNKNTIISSSNT